MDAANPPPRHISYSSKHSSECVDYPIPDIDSDTDFSRLFMTTRDHTMTGKDAMYALYTAAKYVAKNNIPGDVVECGVWKGGSALLAAIALREAGDDRSLHLFDTYEGMTPPTDVDIDIHGGAASGYIEQYADDGKWCYAGIDEVRETFAQHGFVEPQVKFVQGDVLQTLHQATPESISILRLDTDWYESTKAELEILYPKLAVGGVLIIDDYGYWKGSREATDEYFATRRSPLMMRVNFAVRMAIKI